MKRAIKFVSVVMLILLAISGCASKSNPSVTATPEATATPTVTPIRAKIAILLSIGGKGNNSYNDGILTQAQRAEKNLNVKVDVFEPTKAEDYSTIISQLAAQGTYDLIIVASPDGETAVRKYAALYPKQKFNIVDASINLLANVKCIQKSYAEMTFLAGALAGLITKQEAAAAATATTSTGISTASKKDTIGIIVAAGTKLSKQAIAGFTAGVKMTNSNTEVKVVTVGSLTDKIKSKAAALSLYKSGAKIVMCFAGEASMGVIEAATESGGYVIGASINQNSLAPNNIIASCTEATGLRLYAEIEKILAETWQGGIDWGALREGATDIVYDGSKISVSKDIKDQIAELKHQIVTEQIIVPSDASTIDTWLKSIR